MNVGRVVIGGILVILGILFLLDVNDVIEAGDAFGRWWPLVLVIVGGVQLLNRPVRLGPPLVLIGLGVVLLLATLDVFAVSVWQLFWPLVLIAVGVWFVIGRGAGTPGADPSERITSVALFSGKELSSTSPAFRGGTVLVAFGGTELDLTGARVATEGASLDVGVAFGGAEITVPEGWRVDVTGLPLFGGWSNKAKGEALSSDAPRLHVNALTLFGGMEIKRRATV